MTQRTPRDGEHVLGYVSDPEVGIKDEPAVVWMYDGHWWSGLPGKFNNLRDNGWTVTRWQPLPRADGEEQKR